MSRIESFSVEQARANMIAQQIRTWDVLDDQILETLQAVPRECFVPEGSEHLAFVDTQVPLGEGQCMLAPKVEARLLQALSLTAQDTVLEIGAGSGYMAALMGHLAQAVVSVEKRAALVSFSQHNLQQASVSNVSVHEGNGFSPDAPWAHREVDVIVISGGLPKIPDAFLRLLKPQGRLCAIIGQAPIMRAVVITRGAHGWSEQVLFDTLVPMLDDHPFTPAFRF
jgi:protein-L-isoaspartate(D-aspartate) O-methyltransferase